MKKSVQLLLEKGKFCLTEEQYKKLEYYATKGMWLNLRVLLSDIVEDFEIKEALEGGMAKEWVTLNEMVDISIDLAIEDEERVNEERRIIVRTKWRKEPSN